MHTNSHTMKTGRPPAGSGPSAKNGLASSVMTTRLSCWSCPREGNGLKGGLPKRPAVPAVRLRPAEWLEFESAFPFRSFHDLVVRSFHPGGAGSLRSPRHRSRLGAHAPRFQGGPVVRARLRRLLLPPGAGRGAGVAAQL